MDTSVRRYKEDEKRMLEGLGLQPITKMGVFQSVWLCEDEASPDIFYVTKAMDKDSYEARALQVMQRLTSPRNVAIMGQLLEFMDVYVFLMPSLKNIGFWHHPGFDWSLTLKHLYTIIDGIQFMHENNIAFIDIKPDNLVFSGQVLSFRGSPIPKDSMYFIDFEAARILPDGPGSGVTISDFESVPGTYPPPEGMNNLDPYAYDIYSLGETLNWLVKYRRADGAHLPRSLVSFTESLTAAIPSKRPSIFRVRRQYSVLRVWMACTAWMYTAFGTKFGDTLGELGWKVLSVCVR